MGNHNSSTGSRDHQSASTEPFSDSYTTERLYLSFAETVALSRRMDAESMATEVNVARSVFDGPQAHVPQSTTGSYMLALLEFNASMLSASMPQFTARLKASELPWSEYPQHFRVPLIRWATMVDWPEDGVVDDLQGAIESDAIVALNVALIQWAISSGDMDATDRDGFCTAISSGKSWHLVNYWVQHERLQDLFYGLLNYEGNRDGRTFQSMCRKYQKQLDVFRSARETAMTECRLPSTAELTQIDRLRKQTDAKMIPCDNNDHECLQKINGVWGFHF